jgi:general secretion pathway protein A
MYLEHFALKEFPFRLTPDSDFLFMSSGHARAKAYMDYTVWNREGFVVLTGEIGSGKTTLIQKLLSELDDDQVQVAKVFQTQLDEVEFLQAVLVEFGLNPFNAKKVELIDMLNTFLVDNYSKGRQIVLVVDDAHNLGIKVLEEIRMLSGLETQKEKILHVILVGQPQLNELLDAPELEQLLQRVRLRFHIKALSEQDTQDYVNHRLKVAGAQRTDIFATEAIPVIFKYAGGIPRLVNTLCDTSLICAFADGVESVGVDMVLAAVDEMQWLPYAKRINNRRLRERARRVTPGESEGLQEKNLRDIGARLNQLDSLAPSLTLIADRMASIESLLGRIGNLLVETRGGPDVGLRKKGGSGDR